MRRILVTALVVIAASASGQSTGARISPQFVRYTLGDPSNNTISELAVPLFAVMPVSQLLTLDVGTAFASARLTNTSGGQSTESTISGLTDTQLRATLNLGTDMVVLTAGVNIPTGRSTVKPDEQGAAGLIGNDFLTFPISSMGSGFGGTGGVALARPMGSWNLGAGLSVRHSMPFDPYEDATGAKLRYTPGNETRARLGLDHPYGTGRASVGVTYSKFSNDQIATSVYNTGDRLLTQGYVTSAAGSGDYVLSAWDLFRASGTQADGSASGRENITDLSASYGMPVGGARLEPGLGVRTWMQQGSSVSLQTTFSLRYEQPMGPLTVSPGAGFTIGKLATGTTAAGVAQPAANLSGFRAQLTIRTH
jgi:hypothetical protein